MMDIFAKKETVFMVKRIIINVWKASIYASGNDPVISLVFYNSKPLFAAFSR